MVDVIEGQSDLHLKANTGLYFQKQKNFIEAKRIYQEMIIEFSNHFYPWHLLGNLAIEMGQMNEARKHLEMSLSLNRDIIDNYINLSFIYFKNKDYSKTEKILKDGINIDNENLKLKLNLSELYLIQGKLGEVTAIDKNILKKNPDNYYILNRLHDLGEYVLDKTLKEKLKQLAKKENTASQKLIYANFLLSKYEKKIDRHKNEYSYLSKAHELVFQLNKEYFTSNNSFIFNKLKNIHNYFDQDLQIKSSNKHIKPIFIFGLPRSGSTLIEKIILKGTSNYISGEETRIFNSLVDNIFFTKDKINILKCLDQINDKYLELIKSDENANCFTDKSLNNFFFLGWIKKLFPNAKLINCSRDPLIIISSVLRNNLQNLSWAHKINDIVQYIDTYNNVLKKWRDEFNINLYEINYSNLVNDFEYETKKLFKFCEIDWNPDLINFNKNNYISHTASNIKIRNDFSVSEDAKHLGLAKFMSNKIKKYDF